MSTTLSTTAMVNQLKARVPAGFDDAYAMDRLNQSFRWIEQKTSWIWQLKRTTVTVSVGATTFTIPSDAEPGKAMWLSGPAVGSASAGVEITYKGYASQFFNAQISRPSPGPGLYTGWLFDTNYSGSPPTYAYIGRLLPDSAKPTITEGAFTLPFAYHTKTATPLNMATNVYFPSPDDFDDIILLRAESEIRRIFSWLGWEEARQDAESALNPLMDQYRTTKRALEGTSSQETEVAQTNLKRQG